MTACLPSSRPGNLGVTTFWKLSLQPWKNHESARHLCLSGGLRSRNVPRLELDDKRCNASHPMGQVGKVCKPQANEICTTYDLFKTFSQVNASIDEY